MIDLLARYVDGERDIRVIDEVNLDVGRALLILIDDIRTKKRRWRVARLRSGAIITRERLPIGTCRFLYEAPSSKELGPLQDALWYFTRPNCHRRLIGQGLRIRLEELCLARRSGLHAEAKRLDRYAARVRANLRRRSLLFAARIHAEGDVLRVLRLPDGAFEKLIRARLNTQGTVRPVSELLADAERLR